MTQKCLSGEFLLKIQLVSPWMKKCQTTLPRSSIRQISSDSIQHCTKQYSILIQKRRNFSLLNNSKQKTQKLGTISLLLTKISYLESNIEKKSRQTTPLSTLIATFFASHFNDAQRFRRVW